MMKKLIYIYILSASILLANNDTIEINLEQNTSSNNPLEITLKVTNISNHTIQITPSNFAYDDGVILRDLFTVLEDGEKIPYIGPTVMISPEKKTLAEDQSYQGHVNIEEYYKVKKGTHIYEIYYGKQDNKLANSLEIETTITKKKKRYAKKSRARARARTCSNNQLSSLNSSLQDARAYTLKIRNNLLDSSSNHMLYRKWFGTATLARYNTVYSNYSKIYSGLYQNVTYDCTNTRICARSIAYVYKNSPYKIHICPTYWKEDSLKRVSIYIHEMSHFSNVADTLDGDGTLTQYGTPAHIGDGWAKLIAKYNPTAAIHNSYSYQYYAYALVQSYSAEGETSSLRYDFNNNGNAQGWRYRNITPYGPFNGAWFFQARYNDPQLISPNISINANVIKKITIRMANAFTSPYYSSLQLFWKNGNNGYSKSRSKIISIANNGEWTTYTIDMSNDYRWRGNISQIRIDPLTRGDGHWIGIDYIRFTR